MQTETVPARPVPLASTTRTHARYFRDMEDGGRWLTIVYKLHQGFVYVGHALCKPDTFVPFDGKLFRRTKIEVPLDAHEQSLLAIADDVDRLFGSSISDDEAVAMLTEATLPVEQVPPASDQIRYVTIPHFKPIKIKGLVRVKGDSFSRAKGREIATERLNNEIECVRVLPRQGETLLHTALRGLRDDEREFATPDGIRTAIISDRVKTFADEVIGWCEMEQEEEEKATAQKRHPFWSRISESFTALFKG